jgi:glycosyltransferase involved in cell wall biosynthesis
MKLSDNLLPGRDASPSKTSQAETVLVVIPHRIATMGFMHSQVVQPFSYLAQSGLPVTLLTVGSGDESVDRDFAKTCAALGVEVVFALAHPLALMRFLQSCWLGVRLLRERPSAVLYAREVWGGLLLCIMQAVVGRGRIVYDFRGAVPAEVRYTSPNWRGRLKAGLFHILERLIVGRASMMSAVTRELADHVEAVHGKRPQTVIPCCVVPPEATRVVEGVRTALGFKPEDCVLVYAGGMNAWQQFDHVVAMMRELAVREGHFKLLVLTSEKAAAGAMLGPALPENTYRVLSLPQHEVTGYMRAGDAGVLFREDLPFNQVAFPIKFAEYLSAGLPVIVTPGAKAIARLVEEHGLGLVTRGNWADDVAGWLPAAKADHEMRRHCETFADEHLTWSAHEQSFQALYSWNG